jgi:hypothetical protein
MLKDLKGLPTGYNKVSDLKLVEGTNFLYGGLNLIYGIDGSGKSWQLAMSFASEAVYIDTDGSNGSEFLDHCTSNEVHYINSDTVETFKSKTTIGKILGLIEAIVKENPEQLIFVVDSLSSINEGGNINNSEDISPIMYAMNNFAEKHSISLILVDHATENRELPDGFKLEGNAGAKRRSTVTVNKYISHNKAYPALGGSFICERARGNKDGLSKGNVITIHPASLNDAKAWLTNKFPKLLEGESITATELTKVTKNKKDLWIRRYKAELFTETINNRTTYLKLKG